MSVNSILDILKEALAAIPSLVSSALTALAPLKGVIQEQFGRPGLMAVYIAVGVIGLLVLWRLTKITFAVLKYLVVPAIGLAFLVSLVSPYSFVTALPATVTLCSLVLLVKG